MSHSTPSATTCGQWAPGPGRAEARVPRLRAARRACRRGRRRSRAACRRRRGGTGSGRERRGPRARPPDAGAAPPPRASPGSRPGSATVASTLSRAAHGR
ncbi:hypothetical protein C5C31_10915 [Rathayibacter rathayi]|uniref:Uncharacterized protein n=1 Tax=Rathayibacter rathayi TaxID=33887 RepID=A0ABX5AAJ3_RATRA|nr:hypothetical protein C5C20_09560 [Rathayibacter rathayi]PPG87770.1 hypothetical protein C5C47_09565 [Rathayibacter rathayi]PPG95615.1 hypothetical protein C5C00_10065 [Rathayibacter rathayi]PPH20803.1 hypothetical protein C5C31_10915 [Rathayibacter rathayi]PPH75074.1 hypothetical protein C5C40_12005 [Rathayibacter rathayi]